MHSPIDIYSTSDLKKLIENKTISKSIIIRGNKIKSLEGVRVIKGSLGISSCSISSLGELEKVYGNFWISQGEIKCDLASLGSLNYVGKDLILRYSEVKELGCLKKVKGTLSIRDTQINSLGLLEEVGNLFLPKRLEGFGLESGVLITGKLRFWNDSLEFVKKAKIKNAQIQCNVPSWKPISISWIGDLEKANSLQKDFYKLFKRLFFENKFLDIRQNWNYLEVLKLEIINQFKSEKNPNWFEDCEKKLVEQYNSTIDVVKVYNSLGLYDLSIAFLKKTYGFNIENWFELELKTKHFLFFAEIPLSLIGINSLTSFSQSKLDDLKVFIEFEFERYFLDFNLSFFSLFYRNGEFVVDSELLKIYNQSGLNGLKNYKANEVDTNSISNIHFDFEVVDFVKTILSDLIRNAENKLREFHEVPKIGEGWISETRLFNEIKEQFKGHVIDNHHRPDWLGLQHLDIYFVELNIGVEYQGKQHNEPVEFFGGEEAFKLTQERDNRKRILCSENDCILVYVYPDYDKQQVFDEIEKAIKIQVTR